MSSPLKVLSLFSGCGGLDYGFHHNSAFSVEKAFDSMKYAVDVYNANYETEGVDVVGEVLDVQELLNENDKIHFSPDIIIGGPPCQDFSVAGTMQLGTRANLTKVFTDIVVKYKPKYFVMENVPTIKTVGKQIYDSVLDQFKYAGYEVSSVMVHMPDYGVPQMRKRMIVIGVLGSGSTTIMQMLIERKDNVKSLREYIQKTGINFNLDGKEHVYRHPCNYSRRGVISIDELYPTVRGVLRKMPPTYNFHENDTCKTREGVLNPTWQFAALIQTFPSDFKFGPKNNALIIGNSVPPKFSKILAEVISQFHSQAV